MKTSSILWAASAAFGAGWLFTRKAKAAGSQAPRRGASIGSQSDVERLARQAAQRYDFPAWVLLATAQAEGGMQHGAPYMDTNDQLSFRPYGFQAQSGVTVRGGRWLSEWHAGGDRRKRIQAEVEADLARLEAVTNDAALLMDRYYNRYNGDVDLVRVAWAAGGGAANKARDAGRLPGWYDQRKRDRWHAAVRRWGGSVQTAFA